MEETFTCETCSGTFVKGRPDQEAQQEYDELFPEARAREDETAMLCDDCWQNFMAWARTNGISL